MKNHVLVAVGLIGLVEVLAPRLVVSAFTRLAYRDRGAASARDWLHTVVRVEGAVVVLLALLGLFRSAQSAAREADAADAALEAETATDGVTTATRADA